MKGALGKNFFANLRTGHLVLILIMVLIVIFRIFINNSIALIYYYTWVIFILILVFAALCWKTVIKQFKKIKKINWIILAIIIVVALILRIYIMSEPSHLSQSEWDYKYIAKQLIYPDRDYRIVVTAEKPIGSSFMLHIFFLVFLHHFY